VLKPPSDTKPGDISPKRTALEHAAVVFPIWGELTGMRVQVPRAEEPQPRLNTWRYTWRWGAACRQASGSSGMVRAEWACWVR